jgi:hypothetical protein
LVSLKKLDHSVSYFRLSGFGRLRRIKAGAKFEDSRVFRGMKNNKKYQGAKTEEIQAQRRCRKNGTIRFGIPEYPVFTEQIESD